MDSLAAVKRRRLSLFTVLGDGISLQIIYVIICVVIHRQTADRDPHLIKTNRHQNASILHMDDTSTT